MDRRVDLIVAKELLANKRISVTARLLLGFLLDHRNKETGQCNPKRRTLARELGLDTGEDKGKRRITRALAELRKAGFIRSAQGQYTNFYEIFRVDKNVHPEHVQGGQNRPAQDGQKCPPWPSVSLYEPYKGEQARSRHPSQKTSRNAPNPGIPRKSATSETLRCYYEQQRKAGKL